MAQNPETNWIWLPNDRETLRDKARVVYFRKEIFLEEPQDSFRIQISADTRYKLYVNNTFVQFGPARGDNSIWFYDEHELSSYLKHGIM